MTKEGHFPDSRVSLNNRGWTLRKSERANVLSEFREKIANSGNGDLREAAKLLVEEKFAAVEKDGAGSGYAVACKVYIEGEIRKFKKAENERLNAVDNSDTDFVLIDNPDNNRGSSHDDHQTRQMLPINQHGLTVKETPDSKPQNQSSNHQMVVNNPGNQSGGLLPVSPRPQSPNTPARTYPPRGARPPRVIYINTPPNPGVPPVPPVAPVPPVSPTHEKVGWLETGIAFGLGAITRFFLTQFGGHEYSQTLDTFAVVAGLATITLVNNIDRLRENKIRTHIISDGGAFIMGLGATGLLMEYTEPVFSSLREPSILKPTTPVSTPEFQALANNSNRLPVNGQIITGNVVENNLKIDGRFWQLKTHAVNVIRANFPSCNLNEVNLGTQMQEALDVRMISNKALALKPALYNLFHIFGNSTTSVVRDPAINNATSNLAALKELGICQ